MKFVIAVIFSLLVSCQAYHDNPPDVKAIHNWIMNYESSIRKGDIEALLSAHSDAVVFLPPNKYTFSGKDNLRKWYSDYFNYYKPAETLFIRDIKVRGDLAYVSCNYILTVQVKYSGEEFKDSGKLMNIFKREPIGNWRCIYSIWNSNNRFPDLHSMIPADFSGEWQLDITRTTPVPDIVSSRLVISQKGNNINIERNYEFRNRDSVKTSLNCTIGRKVRNYSASGSFITDSHWSEDKQSFTITEKLISKEGKEFRRSTTYSLTARGENLNVISYDEVPEGAIITDNLQKVEMTYVKL